MGRIHSTRDAYGEILVELGKEETNLVVLDSDVAKATRSAKFAERYPERFFNVGCAEQNMMSVAAGLALTGKVPFVSGMAVFDTCRALDQIRTSVCYPKLNVKIIATHGGITVGADGPTHHAIEDIGVMRTLPNMTIVVPADYLQAKKAVEASFYFHGPVYVRLGRADVPDIFSEETPFEIGKGIILRDGNDVSIIATGILLAKAMDAAVELEKEGISTMVINIHTIKPIDRELIIQAACRTGCIVTTEEHNIIGGLGSAVAEVLVRDMPVPMEQVGVADIFAESGNPEELLEKYGLTDNDIIRAVQKVIRRKRDSKT